VIDLADMGISPDDWEPEPYEPPTCEHCGCDLSDVQPHIATRTVGYPAHYEGDVLVPADEWQDEGVVLDCPSCGKVTEVE
jgi:hypothetical protein